MGSVRERLEELIQQPVDSFASAAQVAKAAEALAEIIRAEEEASRVFGIAPLKEPTRTISSHDLAGMTLHDAAETVLRDAGIPLHVRELGKRIKARGWTHPRSSRPRPDQILYQLAARLPRHPRVFNRVAPNTFALVDWETVASSRVRPRFGLFKGPGGVAAETGEHPERTFEGTTWRSS